MDFYAFYSYILYSFNTFHKFSIMVNKCMIMEFEEKYKHNILDNSWMRL